MTYHQPKFTLYTFIVISAAVGIVAWQAWRFASWAGRAIFGGQEKTMNFIQLAPEPKRNLLQEALQFLIERGHLVERPIDIPGLYHIDNGPELTTRQVIDFAYKDGFR